MNDPRCRSSRWFAGVLAALLILIGTPSCGKSTSPARQVVGVSMAYFDDNFLTILRTAMADYAETFPSVVLQFTDAATLRLELVRLGPLPAAGAAV